MTHSARSRLVKVSRVFELENTRLLWSTLQRCVYLLDFLHKTDSVVQAIDLSSTEDPIMYDSRAAVYEKLGQTKDALLDSKKVVHLFPERWQVGHFQSYSHHPMK